jgi:hypothetical protein
MDQKLYQLVKKGLDYETLRDLCRLSRASFGDNPSLYGTLEYIFGGLAEEYDGQAITVERAKQVNETMQPPVLALLGTAEDSPRVLLSRLDEVWRGFRSLER